MGTLIDKLEYLRVTKLAIKRAIRSKGIEVSDNDTFRSYANKIESIPEGIDYSNIVVNESVAISYPRGVAISNNVSSAGSTSYTLNVERG